MGIVLSVVQIAQMQVTKPQENNFPVHQNNLNPGKEYKFNRRHIAEYLNYNVASHRRPLPRRPMKKRSSPRSTRSAGSLRAL